MLRFEYLSSTLQSYVADAELELDVIEEKLFLGKVDRLDLMF